MKYFSFIDASNGSHARAMAKNVASWLSARGLSVVILDSAGSQSGRRLSEAARFLGTMDGEVLAGYLAAREPGTKCPASYGKLICDIKPGLDALDLLSSSFNLILFAAGKDLHSIPSEVIGKVPAIICVSIFEDGLLAASSKFIDKMVKDGEIAGASGFVMDGSDSQLAARFANQWRLPFWGFAKDTPHIADRVLGQSPDPVLPAYKVAKNVLHSLRADPEFKDLGAPSGDGDASEVLRQKIASTARRILMEGGARDTGGIDREDIVKMVLNNSVGFGPIECLLEDPSVTEIMINGPENIYVERAGVIEQCPLKFEDERQLFSVIDRMVAKSGRRIDESSPMVDARLPDGSRLNVIIPPLAINGPAATIRRFLKKMRGVEDAITSGMLTRSAAIFLTACVKEKISLVVSGGTSSGKTTLLGILAAAIDKRERIVTIEDAAELVLAAPHVVRLESRPPGIDGTGAITIRDLVRNALRMRPDRIIVGECRGPEALDMLQAMNTGHEGSLTTVHANSPRDALSRLETMVLMAGIDLPLASIREQIVRAVNLIIQVGKTGCGERKILEITELTGLEGTTPCMQTLASYSHSKGELEPTGMSPRFAERLKSKGIELPRLL